MHFDLAGILSDPDAAWEAVTDTDWMNREAGSGRVLSMDVQVDEHGYPRIHGALEGPLGMRLPFVEDENHWVRGRSFFQGRTYSSGPLLRSEYTVRIEQVDGGVVPHLTLDLLPRSALLNPVVIANLRRIRGRWYRVLRGIPAPEQTRSEPLRQLGPAAEHAFRTWSQDVPEVVADRVRELLVTSRPYDLQQLRALALADTWGLDRDEVASAFLKGSQTGLLELYWSVRCPRCEAQTSSTPHLGNLADHSECSSCRIGFEADLGENVEVLFAPQPGLVERIDESFCTLFPQSAPRIVASVILRPGERWVEAVGLEPGVWRLGAGGDQPDLSLQVGSDGPTAVDWSSSAAGEVAVAAGPVTIRLHNDGDGHARVQLARVDARPPILAASHVTTLPEFRREMSHQVLAADIRISTRSVCLLFSDLTGSTAMYEELGDAAAYALVRDHFRVLQQAVEAHRGSVVKTIGDAVMAAFDEPGLGVAAGIQMVRDFDLWVDTLGMKRPPRLKVGVHVGPALVVHTDASGLDYFGQTANVAARTQGMAAGGELMISDDAAAWSTVQSRLAQSGLRAEAIEVSLKGVSGTVRLHRVVVGKSDES